MHKPAPPPRRSSLQAAEVRWAKGPTWLPEHCGCVLVNEIPNNRSVKPLALAPLRRGTH